MKKRPNKKQRDFSIRLKTSFAVQTHLEEILALKEKAIEVGLSKDNEFIQIMEEALADSISIIFPKPFEA